MSGNCSNGIGFVFFCLVLIFTCKMMVEDNHWKATIKGTHEGKMDVLCHERVFALPMVMWSCAAFGCAAILLVFMVGATCGQADTRADYAKEQAANVKKLAERMIVHLKIERDNLKIECENLRAKNDSLKFKNAEIILAARKKKDENADLSEKIKKIKADLESAEKEHARAVADIARMMETAKCERERFRTDLAPGSRTRAVLSAFQQRDHDWQKKYGLLQPPPSAVSSSSSSSEIDDFVSISKEVGM